MSDEQIEVIRVEVEDADALSAQKRINDGFDANAKSAGRFADSAAGTLDRLRDLAQRGADAFEKSADSIVRTMIRITEIYGAYLLARKGIEAFIGSVVAGTSAIFAHQTAVESTVNSYRALRLIASPTVATAGTIFAGYLVERAAVGAYREGSQLETLSRRAAGIGVKRDEDFEPFSKSDVFTLDVISTAAKRTGTDLESVLALINHLNGENLAEKTSKFIKTTEEIRNIADPYEQARKAIDVFDKDAEKALASVNSHTTDFIQIQRQVRQELGFSTAKKIVGFFGSELDQDEVDEKRRQELTKFKRNIDEIKQFTLDEPKEYVRAFFDEQKRTIVTGFAELFNAAKDGWDKLGELDERMGTTFLGSGPLPFQTSVRSELESAENDAFMKSAAISLAGRRGVPGSDPRAAIFGPTPGGRLQAGPANEALALLNQQANAIGVAGNEISSKFAQSRQGVESAFGEARKTFEKVNQLLHVGTITVNRVDEDGNAVKDKFGNAQTYTRALTQGEIFGLNQLLVNAENELRQGNSRLIALQIQRDQIEQRFRALAELRLALAAKDKGGGVSPIALPIAKAQNELQADSTKILQDEFGNTVVRRVTLGRETALAITERLQDQIKDKIREEASFALNEWDKVYQERLNKEGQLAQKIREFESETIQLRQQNDEHRLQFDTYGAQATRDERLRALEQQEAGIIDINPQQAAARKIAIEQQKLNIETDYLRRAGKYQDDEIRRRAEQEATQYETQLENLTAPKATGNAVIDATAQANYEAQQKSIEDRISAIKEGADEQRREAAIRNQDEIEKAQEDSVIRQTTLRRDAIEREFNSLKDSAGRLFDAALTGTKSFGDAVKDIFRNAFLTPVREFVSSWTAALLLRGGFGDRGSILGFKLPMPQLADVGPPGAMSFVPKSKLEQPGHLGDVALANGAVPVVITNAAAPGSGGPSFFHRAAGIGALLSAAPAITSGGGTTPSVSSSISYDLGGGQLEATGVASALSEGPDAALSLPYGGIPSVLNDLGPISAPAGAAATRGTGFFGRLLGIGGFGGGGLGGGAIPIESGWPGGTVYWDPGRGKIFTGSSTGGGGGLGGIFSGLGGLKDFVYNSGSIATGPGTATTAGGIGGIGGGLAGFVSSPAGALAGGLLVYNGLRTPGLAGSAQTVGGATLLGASVGSHIGSLGMAGGAIVGVGGGLIADGLRRGGFIGLGEDIAGGAAIGARFGGPLGAAIGAGVGAVAGLIRLGIKGFNQQVQERIQNDFGVKVEGGTLAQIVQLIKQNYGGQIDVGIHAPQVVELIQLYAQATGQQHGIANKARASTLTETSRGLTQQAIYENGEALSFNGVSVYGGVSTRTIQSAARTASGGIEAFQQLPNGLAQYVPNYPSGEGYTTLPGASQTVGGQNVSLSLDAEATRAVLEGRAASVISGNPRMVQSAVSAAQSSNFDRRQALAQQLQPSELLA